jgi:hypothetical protein
MAQHMMHIVHIMLSILLLFKTCVFMAESSFFIL